MMKSWGIPLAAALIAVIISLIFYADLPEEMAVHFGPYDNADRHAHKAVGAFLLPAVILLLPALTNLNLKLERDESKRNRFREFHETINVVMALMLLAIHVLVIGINLGYELRVSMFVPLAVGLVFITIGNMLPRAPQLTSNRFRIKDEYFARFARFNGRCMVAAGFLMPSAGLMPGRCSVSFFFAVIAALILTVIGSYIYCSRK